MFLQLSLDYDGKFASFKNYHLRFINHHILGSTAVKSEYTIIKHYQELCGKCKEPGDTLLNVEMENVPNLNNYWLGNGT